MKYLFFDIECANSLPDCSKICSFGYVLTDEKFNIIDKDDILINPDGPFYFYNNPNDDKQFSLRYSESVFRDKDGFPKHYNRIKELLENDDQLIFGHAVENDAHFISDEVMYYDLDSINFSFCDTQIIYQEYAKTSEFISLENANKVLDTTLHQEDAHDSLSDALMTMAIAKKMSEDLNKDLKTLVDEFPRCKGELNNYKISLKKNIIVTGDEMLSFHNYVKFKENYIPTIIGDLLKNKLVFLPLYLKSKMTNQAINITKQIMSLGGIVTKENKFDIYVHVDSVFYNDVKFYNKVLKNESIKIFEYDDFLKYIKLDNVDISKVDIDLINIAVNGKTHKEIKNDNIVNSYIERKEQTKKEKQEECLGSRFQDFFSEYLKK